MTEKSAYAGKLLNYDAAASNNYNATSDTDDNFSMEKFVADNADDGFGYQSWDLKYILPIIAQGQKVKEALSSRGTLNIRVSEKKSVKIPRAYGQGTRRTKGPDLEKNALTLKRFYALCTARLIDEWVANKGKAIDGFVNPLAQSAGFSSTHGLIYILFGPATEYFFYQFPTEVAAAGFYRFNNASKMGITSTGTETLATLVRQKTSGQTFSEWITEPANKDAVEKLLKEYTEQAGGNIGAGSIAGRVQNILDAFFGAEKYKANNPAGTRV